MENQTHSDTMLQAAEATIKNGKADKKLIAFSNLYDKVGSTLGPAGRYVMYNPTMYEVEVTKDGATVARQVVDMKDGEMNMILTYIKEACSNTLDQAGDGTTTAIVIAAMLYIRVNKALSLPENKPNRVEIINQIVKDKDQILAILKESSYEIETPENIYDISLVSCDGDKAMADLIKKCFDFSGQEGGIIYGHSYTTETWVDQIKGMKMDCGGINDNVLGPTGKWVANDVAIMMVDENIDIVAQTFAAALTVCVNSNFSLLVMARTIDPLIVNEMITLAAQKGVKMCLTFLPEVGDMRGHIMNDLAAYIDGQYITISNGLSFIDMGTMAQVEKSMGFCTRVVIDKDAIIFEPHIDDETIRRVDERLALIEQIEAKTEFAKNWKRVRKAKLTGKLTSVRMGAPTPAEAGQKLDSLEDGIKAVRMAYREGFVAGGGVALLEAVKTFYEKNNLKSTEDVRVQIWGTVARAVISTIVVNKFGSEDRQKCDDIVNKVFGNNIHGYGYNARTGELENLLETGIIDATGVVCVALNNAVEIVKIMLRTKHVIPMPMNDRAAFM